MNKQVIGYKKAQPRSIGLFNNILDNRTVNYLAKRTRLIKYHRRFNIAVNAYARIEFQYRNIIYSAAIHNTKISLLLKRYHIWRIVQSVDLVVCSMCIDPTIIVIDREGDHVCDWCGQNSATWNLYTIRYFSANIHKILNNERLLYSC